MKRLKEWQMPETDQKFADRKADQTSVGVRPRPKPESKDEHVDESSIGWSGTDTAESSIFDTGSLRVEKTLEGKTGSHTKFKLVGDSTRGGEEDDGIDPYNTGRFESKNS